MFLACPLSLNANQYLNHRNFVFQLKKKKETSLSNMEVVILGPACAKMCLAAADTCMA